MQHRFVFQEESSLLPHTLEQIPDLFKQGTIIYNQRNQIRVLELQGRLLNIKKFCVPAIFNRILYSIGLRLPKAQRAYNNALAIRKHGFNSPKPYGYILERKNGLLGYSYLITEHIPESTSLAQQPISKLLIRKLARYTTKLHEGGILHRDYTLNNIISKEGVPSFFLVDVNQCYIQNAPISVSRALPYLIQLFQKQENLLLFISAYAYCRKVSSRYCCQVALQLRQERTAFSRLKKCLKKIPGASLLQSKRLNKQTK